MDSPKLVSWNSLKISSNIFDSSMKTYMKDLT